MAKGPDMARGHRHDSGPRSGAIRQDDRLLLPDPTWQLPEPPPMGLTVGSWPLDESGRPGPFEPNPDYVPFDDETPTDPADALLRQLMNGRDVGDRLIGCVRDAIVEIAVDDQDQPFVTPDPNGVMCVLVATAPAQRTESQLKNWWPIVGARLPEVVPDEVDILLNPDGPAPFRISPAALANG
jgi:hypothetical protein